MKKIALFASLCVSIGLLYGCSSEVEVKKEPKKEQEEKGTITEEWQYYIYQDHKYVILLSVIHTETGLDVGMKTTGIIKNPEGKIDEKTQEAVFTGVIQKDGSFVLQSKIGVSVNGKLEKERVQLELPDQNDKNKNIWYSFEKGTEFDYQEAISAIKK